MEISMIFYFSGTGNSLYVAKRIANHIGDELIGITVDENNSNVVNEYSLKENETLGFVFPVYAWGAPKIVVEFLERLKINQYKNHYTYCIITCGDNIGNAMKGMEHQLSKQGIPLMSGFSITMPNNYILMGNVDSKEVEEQKIQAVDHHLIEVLEAVKQRETGIFKMKKGSNAWLLTSVINPLFNKFAIDTSKFYAKDTCTSCGICEKICKCSNIKVDGKPQWGNHCTQCLSCIHYCPVNAVQYGKATEHKERYTNPKVKVSEMLGSPCD